MAAVEPRDDSSTFKTKAGLIADYLDLVFARRLVNDLPSSGAHLDREAVRLVERLRGGVSIDKLRTLLAEEAAALDYDFTGMKTYGLRSNNSRQVRYLLARLTGFVETACERGDDMHRYLDAQRPFEIEHIWANHFERYQPETGTRAVFDSTATASAHCYSCGSRITPVTRISPTRTRSSSTNARTTSRAPSMSTTENETRPSTSS
ncbi:hypothetical protein SRB17_59060 [Streptomyces sp. RB17]|uniref:hypothetical protein n=1 Tax=Streptomyces sp. RB17 TaxID=2585197 RepID=UPI001307292F|nr:hypothetical protein [Streptomyces sp. RB17]MQY37898.1 hypothetical protein [Streptomyces sp. RB17]